MYETVNRLPLRSNPVGLLRASNEVLRLKPTLTHNGEDSVVEVLLPHVDIPNVALHIAPYQLLISSDIDEAGLQMCQVIDLPYNVSMDGVDAEQSSNLIRIPAALA